MDNIKFDLYYRRVLDSILDAGDATSEQEVRANKDQDFRQF
jgi:hypothetical protein